MKKITLSTLAILSLITACSNPQNSANTLEHWKLYHNQTLNQMNLEENQAITVFYRMPEFTGKAVNVYVNQDYQASLLPSSFSAAIVCANNPLLSTSYTNDQKFGNRTQGIRPILTAGKTHYFKMVHTKNSEPKFEQVEENQAMIDLSSLKGEIKHTLPRVKNHKCETIKTVKTLSASALWNTNKYSYADMLTQGKKEIIEFANTIKQSDEVTRINVLGFTDPESSEAYNLALSQKRADTVRVALQQAGITLPIQAVGYGEAQLIVADCAQKHSTDLKARTLCNLPNRRVELNVYTK